MNCESCTYEIIEYDFNNGKFGKQGRQAKKIYRERKKGRQWTQEIVDFLK